jgi:hypothetical protein
MTGGTHAALRVPVEARALGRVTAKGKTEAVALYEVLAALPEETRARKLASRAGFESACMSFARGELETAGALFHAWAEDDAAAALYRDECTRAAREPRPAWDGVLRLDVK